MLENDSGTSIAARRSPRSWLDVDQFHQSQENTHNVHTQTNPRTLEPESRLSSVKGVRMHNSVSAVWEIPQR